MVGTADSRGETVGMGTLAVWKNEGKNKSEMRGFLHFATDGETVCCFGRNDEVVGWETGSGLGEESGSRFVRWGTRF
jgi:hypothetical protein